MRHVVAAVTTVLLWTACYTPAGWWYSQRPDGADDSLLMEWALVEGRTVGRNNADRLGKPTFGLRCYTGELAVFMEHESLGNDQLLTVFLRVDSNESLEISLAVEKRAYITETSVVAELIPQMRAGNQMVVRVSDAGGQNHNFEFPLADFTRSIRRLKCL